MNSFSENVNLAYFDEISNKNESSMLLKISAMLQSTINMKYNIEIVSVAVEKV